MRIVRILLMLKQALKKVLLKVNLIYSIRLYKNTHIDRFLSSALAINSPPLRAVD